MTQPDTDTFSLLLRDSAIAASRLWGYDEPNEDFFRAFNERIPRTIRGEIERGVAEGRVIRQGHRFSLPGLTRGKGPYAFFSRNRPPLVPAPNWEYFVQLAEYLRIGRIAPAGFTVGFEDGLMDVSVRNGKRLVWYVEAKEKASQAEQLISGLGRYAPGFDEAASDRGNDALRKAKYLRRHKPAYFSVVAINLRRDHSVRYPRDLAFSLTELAHPPELRSR